MKYLKAYLMICAKHSEDDCAGCPFALSATGCNDCHTWILNHEDKAKAAIVEYVNRIKSQASDPVGQCQNGYYTTKCRNCGRVIAIDERDLIWDSYIDAFLFSCPHCNAEDEVPVNVKTAQ